MTDPVTAAGMALAKSIAMWGGIGATATAGYWVHKKLRGGKRKQGIKDRIQHAWYIGQTNTGKTTMAMNQALDDMEDGYSVVFIDPHGSAVPDMLAMIPREHAHRVVYWSPFKGKVPMGINPLYVKDRDDVQEKILVADQFVKAMEKMVGTGVSIDDIMTGAVKTVLELPYEATIGDVYMLLTDEEYRTTVVNLVRGRDEYIDSYWENVFPNISPTYMTPVLRRLGKIMRNPFLRNALCQTGRAKLDLYDIMATGKVLLCDFEEGAGGEGTSEWIAGFTMAIIQSMTMKRPKRFGAVTPCMIFLDEFQGYVNDSMPKFLSECRKYWSGLHLIHQYVDQLPDYMLDAIWGNVGTYKALRVGIRDGSTVARYFELPDTKLVTDLPNHQVWERLMISGRPRKATLRKTEPPRKKDPKVARDIVTVSNATCGGNWVRISREVQREYVDKTYEGEAVGLDE